MNKDNSLYESSKLNRTIQEGIEELKKDFIPLLVHRMLDKDHYRMMVEKADAGEEEDYTKFSDWEMIYFFVHQERDLDEKKNRTDDTKKEYLRELVWTYGLFVHHGELFEFNVSGSDASLFRHLKKRNIRKYQEWLKKVPLGKGGKPYSVATISRKVGLFKSFLAFLYGKGYIVQPLHESFKSANVHMRDRPNRDISSEEMVQLLDYYREHPIIHCLLSVLVTTGIRIRELCMTRISDLSYDDGTYWLEVTGKGNEKREVLIHPNVYDTIITFRNRRGLETVVDKGDDSLIFVTARHKPYTYKYLSNYLTKAMTRTNLPFIRHKKGAVSPHTLRHGFAIISAEEGVDVFRIMQALGHKKLETTQIYLERQAKRRNHAAHNWKNGRIFHSI